MFGQKIKASGIVLPVDSTLETTSTVFSTSDSVSDKLRDLPWFLEALFEEQVLQLVMYYQMRMHSPLDVLFKDSAHP